MNPRILPTRCHLRKALSIAVATFVAAQAVRRIVAWRSNPPLSHPDALPLPRNAAHLAARDLSHCHAQAHAAAVGCPTPTCSLTTQLHLCVYAQPDTSLSPVPAWLPRIAPGRPTAQRSAEPSEMQRLYERLYERVSDAFGEQAAWELFCDELGYMPEEDDEGALVEAIAGVERTNFAASGR